MLGLPFLFCQMTLICSQSHEGHRVGAGQIYSERDLGSPSLGCGAVARWPCLELCPDSEQVACHQISSLANIPGNNKRERMEAQLLTLLPAFSLQSPGPREPVPLYRVHSSGDSIVFTFDSSTMELIRSGGGPPPGHRVP